MQAFHSQEKSKLDWDKFKKKEGIEEELQTHNKGKDGYVYILGVECLCHVTWQRKVRCRKICSFLPNYLELSFSFTRYIERQAFLNRTDVRQFEIERDIRLGMSGKRWLFDLPVVNVYLSLSECVTMGSRCAVLLVPLHNVLLNPAPPRPKKKLFGGETRALGNVKRLKKKRKIKNKPCQHFLCTTFEICCNFIVWLTTSQSFYPEFEHISMFQMLHAGTSVISDCPNLLNSDVNVRSTEENGDRSDCKRCGLRQNPYLWWQIRVVLLEQFCLFLIKKLGRLFS